MDRDAAVVQQRVHAAWDAMRSGLQKIFPASDVRPTQPLEVFALVAGVGEDEVKFNVRPVVFKVPERATRQDSNLYVALKGWLSFEGPDFRTTPLRTKSFGTQVGYFRSKQGALEHVYGAHYDLDEATAGHPVFHAQVSPQMDMLADVNERFRKTFAEPLDSVRPLLANVRTPCAQMDVFSVVLQICADHLIHAGSPPQVQETFAKMRTACNFFIGAAHRMAYLNVPPASTCYRSTHWYERVPEAPNVGAGP